MSTPQLPWESFSDDLDAALQALWRGDPALMEALERRLDETAPVVAPVIRDILQLLPSSRSATHGCHTVPKGTNPEV